MKNLILALMAVCLISNIGHAQDVEKILKNIVKEEGDWGVVVSQKGTLEIWVQHNKELKRVTNFELDIPPTLCVPLVMKDNYNHNIHRKYFEFKKDEKKPKEPCILYFVEQAHLAGTWDLREKRISFCTHVHSVLVDQKTGKVLKKHFRSEKRVMEIRPAAPRAIPKVKTI